MKKSEKIDLVTRLSADLSGKSFLLFDFKGLNVAAFSKLRRVVKKDGFRVRVIKNTLIKKALEKNSVAGFDDFLVQANALIYGVGDGAALLKDVRKFSKEANVSSTRAAYIDGKLFSDKELVALSNLPGRKALLGILAGSLASPLTGLLFALNFNLMKLVSVLENIKKNKK